MVPHKEEITNSKGLHIIITLFKQLDNTHDILTRRSVTGILLIVNNKPIKWISKSQKTLETSTYESKLVAEKEAMELILEYIYI